MLDNIFYYKKGFTLIELMVVVAIIGVLALLGLRLYTGQQEKAKNAIIKANVGTIQTLIQAELADRTTAAVYIDWNSGALVTSSGIHNPVTGAVQAGHETTLDTAADGEVWVIMTSDVFTINGNDSADADTNVYDTSLTARK